MFIFIRDKYKKKKKWAVINSRMEKDMAFCKFCGKNLEEGEVCTCEGSMAAQQQVNMQAAGNAQPQNQMNGQFNANQVNGQQMNGQQMNGQFNANQMNGQQGTQFNTAQMQQKANEYMQQGMEAAGNAWKNLLGIFKSPAQEGRMYVAKADMTVSLIIIALQAIIAGIFGFICMSRVNDAFSGVTALFSSSKYRVSTAKGFFITLIFSLILSAVFALVFFVAGKIVKTEIDIKKALTITSVRSAAVIPFMLAGCILLYINPLAAFVVFYFGNILAICFVYAATTGICEENKLSYMIAAVVIVFFIIAFIVMSKAVGLYLPSGVKSLSGLSSIMNMLY